MEHCMMKYIYISACAVLIALFTGCGVKQEEVERLDKILVSMKKDIEEIQVAAGEEPESDPNALTPENVDAKYQTITRGFASDIAGVHTSIANLESQIQTLRENLAAAMAQLATSNTEVTTLQGQVTTLQAEKTAAETALAAQVRNSETRVSRVERAADALFDSRVVQQYREQNPGTTKTNQQLTLEIGNHFTQLGQFDRLVRTDPTFADKYEQAKDLSSL